MTLKSEITHKPHVEAAWEHLNTHLTTRADLGRDQKGNVLFDADLDKDLFKGPNGKGAEFPLSEVTPS